MNPIPRLKAYAGPALLSYGFRPFFLAGAIYSGLGVLIWLPLFLAKLTIPTAFSPLDWHIHEMLYGYLPAVITGFLLTAIPNWTGRLPLQGGALAALFATWIAGRIAVSISALIGPLAAAAIDVLFLVLVAAATGREVIAGHNWRNAPPILIVLIFLAGNAIFHLEDHETGTAEFATRLGIAAAIVLISFVGGRLIPSFTHNWLVRENPGRLPGPFGRFDIAVRLSRHDLLSNGISKTVKYQENLPPVCADYTQLQQVISNLIKNAIDAMTCMPLGQRRVRLATGSDGNFVSFYIHDSGPGIADQDRERIFDAFFTTKSTGMGLGLSICRTIMEQHGGTLRLTNTGRNGSTFEIALPILPIEPINC